MDRAGSNSQKHDPAWKHCEMLKIGDRVQLKCIYCGKTFKGGGIHRIKEHLAGFRGNASTCLKVFQEVRQIMQQSLDIVEEKKRKKQKMNEEISGNLNPSLNSISAGELEVYANSNQCGLNTEDGILQVPDTQMTPGLIMNREEEASKRGRKKGRVRRKISDSVAQHIVPVRASNPLHFAIGRFFYDVGIPLDAVNSVYFQPLIDAIHFQGPGAVAPTYHDLRGGVLKNSVEEVRNDIDHIMGFWSKTGCSVLVDECVIEKGKTFVNFFVYCPERTVFFKSSDITDLINSTDALYELVREVVEEVGVNNVVQVVTNSEERYIIVGRKLTDTFPTIFWTPCAAHCVDLILGDIRKIDWINIAFEQAMSISRFIYNHSFVLNMMRRFTYGVDLIDLGVTRYSTDFTVLKRLVNIKHNLHSLVTSVEWMESPYSKKPEGLAMLDYITSQDFWTTCTMISNMFDPLLRVLRLVRSEKRPAMGYIYAGIYRAKERIKKELLNKKEDYQIYWDIIDQRWGQFHHNPLHAAGFYLNPKFFYSTEVEINDLRSLVYDCVEKLVADAKIQEKIAKETTSYHNADGDFGRKMSIRARDTLLPAEWWSTYGGGCPNLARLAIRILSQTCSLTGVKPNRVLFEQMHESKNCLEHQRLTDLFFVQYNLQLKQMVEKNREHGSIMDPTSQDHSDLIGDWIADKDLCSEGHGSSDWMSVDPPFGNISLLGPQIDDVEALGAGFDDNEIFYGAKDSDAENAE